MKEAGPNWTQFSIPPRGGAHTDVWHFPTSSRLSFSPSRRLRICSPPLVPHRHLQRFQLVSSTRMWWPERSTCCTFNTVSIFPAARMKVFPRCTHFRIWDACCTSSDARVPTRFPTALNGCGDWDYSITDTDSPSIKCDTRVQT